MVGIEGDEGGSGPTQLERGLHPQLGGCGHTLPPAAWPIGAAQCRFVKSERPPIGFDLQCLSSMSRARRTTYREAGSRLPSIHVEWISRRSVVQDLDRTKIVEL